MSNLKRRIPDNDFTVIPPSINLNADLHAELLLFRSRHSATQSELRRAGIILHFHNNPVSLSHAALELGYNRDTVSDWYRRGEIINIEWENMLSDILKEPGHAGDKLRKERLIKTLLADKERSGAPCTYTPEQYTAIVALALKSPAEFGRPITNWTARELCDEAHLQKIAVGISSRQIQRFLNQADLQPHKSRYWLNPKIDNQDEYELQVKEICELYANTPSLHENGTHVVSTDEKTGMQALERIAPSKPMKPGKMELIEHEYTRHGTLCLIPSFDVATGHIIESYMGDTRNEFDFAGHIAKTISTDPAAKWIFICDNLNTHISEALVRMVAGEIGFKTDIGVKNKNGILKDMSSRQEFLKDKTHRIRFVYTPKHCSWLNQVEIWFGILVRKVLKRGSFESKTALREKITAFIGYFNRTMAKPFKWTYKGIPLTA